jgi:hypothetical protein
MKSKEIFNAVVRIIGLAFAYHGLAEIPAAILRFCPAFPMPFKYMNFRSIIPSLFAVGIPLVIAYWMIRGAPWLMRLAYGEEEERNAAGKEEGRKMEMAER